LSTGVKRRRKPAQKGVQAVFTPRNDWRGRAQLALGLAAIGAGTAAWTYTTRVLGGFGFGNLVPYDVSFSAIFLPVSIPLLIGGVGLCTYYLAMRRTWRASNRIESALYELEALVGQKNGAPGSSPEPRTVPDAKAARKPRFGLVRKALTVALVEAVLLILIYGGLVQEYASNVNMQNWVQANFVPGSYFLNYNAVLVLAGLLGVLIFQTLPRKLQAEKLQP
jgi:MFS family permease